MYFNWCKWLCFLFPYFPERSYEGLEDDYKAYSTRSLEVRVSIYICFNPRIQKISYVRWAQLQQHILFHQIFFLCINKLSFVYLISYRGGRMKGLFTGVGPRVIRAGPSVGIVFSFYEVVKHILHHQHALS